MYLINDVLIDPSILKEYFACQISSCKGACCVQGDGGAPLTQEEALYLEDNYDKIAPFITEEGKNVIQEKGKYTKSKKGVIATPLIDNQTYKPCVYINYENGIALCGVENAYKKGEIDFQKPISCHLYPIREENIGGFTALKYDKWDICDSACSVGAQQKIALYQFCKAALIRRFGKSFYNQLVELAEQINQVK